MTTAPPDPVFDELASIRGHVASFSADLSSGQLLNVNGSIDQEQASIIQKMMQDVGQLVSRYAHTPSSSGILGAGVGGGGPSASSSLLQVPAGTSLGNHHEGDESLVRKVTVMTESSTLALTMADNKIYGIEKKD